MRPPHPGMRAATINGKGASENKKEGARFPSPGRDAKPLVRRSYRSDPAAPPRVWAQSLDIRDCRSQCPVLRVEGQVDQDVIVEVHAAAAVEVAVDPAGTVVV